MPSSHTSSITRRQSYNQHYQTFPTRPPTSRGKPPSDTDSRTPGDSQNCDARDESPLPKKQLIALAVIALAEQTALNSISPYLPAMASTFPGVDPDQVGIYVGTIATSFALAQFATNFFWGWLSDRIGRKPVILVGTLLTAACFVAFGFCKTLWQAMVVQALMGLVNGNQGVVSTCLGEITDRSNQSKAFAYLPVIYGIGGITGPMVGGLLVSQTDSSTGLPKKYPYLMPNLVSAAILFVDLIVTMYLLEETLEEAKKMKPLGMRMHHLFAWLWQFSSSSRPTYVRHNSPLAFRRQQYGVDGSHDDDLENEEEMSDDTSALSAPALTPNANPDAVPLKEILNRNIVLILLTYFIFQLSNIAYNSLYPIFANAKAPTGRNLSSSEIGISQSFAGLVTIVFQIGFFGRLREKVGNNTTYKLGLSGFVIAFLLMPWVGYKDSNSLFGIQGKIWLWIELGFILIVKTVAAVGGLTSALLMITNSAPDHSVLGTLNGLAQTLSAGGRAVGPFISGALFTAAVHVKPKGEALAFGVFAGISFVGLLMSFGIDGGSLEAEWDEEEGSSVEEDFDGNDEAEELETNERTGLLNGRSK